MMVNSFHDDFDTKIEDELKRALEGIFSRNQQLINNLEAVQTVAGWLREAKQDKKKIPSIITNEAIKWLLKNITPALSKFLINSVKFETGDYLNKPSIKKIEVSFSLKPYVEYVMKVNGIVTKKARITFSVTLPVRLENIQFPSNLGRRYITIEKLVASLTISIIKIVVYVPPIPTIIPLVEPILLCDNQYFKVKNLSFHPKVQYDSAEDRRP